MAMNYTGSLMEVARAHLVPGLWAITSRLGIPEGEVTLNIDHIRDGICIHTRGMPPEMILSRREIEDNRQFMFAPRVEEYLKRAMEKYTPYGSA